MIQLIFGFLRFIAQLFWGDQPPVRVKWTSDDSLREAAGARGAVIVGDPGVGKTDWAAMQIVRKFNEHPGQAIFVFDWSGSLTNAIVGILLRLKDYARHLRSVVLDELGNEEIVIPKPEFSPEYGLTEEEQVNRVVDDMARLASFMVKGAPFLAGVSIEEIGKELCRLLIAVRDAQGESWQLTEGKRLLMDTQLLRRISKEFGHYQPSAKWYFEKEFLARNAMSDREKELSTRALRYVLGKIEGREVRATLGASSPGWTPKEATEKGLLVLIDAHKLINQPAAQHYLLMQNFSLVMSWINKREVDDPSYEPAMIAFDETYTILKIPGMAEWLGMVSPLYRSRKFQLLIIIQALWQLDEELARQVWTLGNVVSFAVSNHDEAEIIARQLFSYNPQYIKQLAKTDSQNPTTEAYTGQDRINADWIQRLKARQFVMRRYLTEQEREEDVLYVRKTRDMPQNPPYDDIQVVKRNLLRERGVFVREALREINSRQPAMPGNEPGDEPAKA